MELFEIHMTATGEKAENLHHIAKRVGHKTITVEQLSTDGSVIEIEHMTSILHKAKSFKDCKEQMMEWKKAYKANGINFNRLKIECPFLPEYEKYLGRSKYVEAHFESNLFNYPTSRIRKVNKDKYLATAREYQKIEYEHFKDIFKDEEIEICLFDSWPEKDEKWMNLFKKEKNDV